MEIKINTKREIMIIGLMSPPVLIAIGLLVILFFATCVSILKQESERVHGQLNEFMREAQYAKSLEELCAIEHRLRDYADKACWHRHYSSHAREVFVYVCGRKGRV
jgi:hypothetical protein